MHLVHSGFGIPQVSLSILAATSSYVARSIGWLVAANLNFHGWIHACIVHGHSYCKFMLVGLMMPYSLAVSAHSEPHSRIDPLNQYTMGGIQYAWMERSGTKWE